jgi:hypothetical protein
MAISGNLEDVSVADVMQFIHLGRRTGTLMLRRDGDRGTIGFHRGKLVSAGSPGTPRLGVLLTREGLLDQEQVDEAVHVQDSEPERRTLGQILLSRGLVAAEDLRRVIADQIEATISELVAWDRGTFEFVVDDLDPVDDIALYPGDVVPDADINTQMVLLEAARIFDERNRDSASPDDTHPAFSRSAEAMDVYGGEVERAAGVASVLTSAEEGWIEPADALDEIGAHRLQIVTSDGELTGALDRALPPGFAAVEPVGVRTAGHPVPGHEPPIVILDLRENGVSVEELGRLRRTRQGTPLVALVDPGAATGKLYEAGAIATVPPEVEAIVACVENLARNRPRSAPTPGQAPGQAGQGMLPGGPGNAAGVERLRRVFGDLRSGLISATVALNLMHIISESVERAVLFLVKREKLVALGAFGAAADGKPLAELTRGMTLSLSEDHALAESYERGEVVSIAFDQARLPERFVSILGEPANGRIVIFPVLGAQRVISVIYTDNGENEGPIEDVDILELATAQVGMAFENELLRRQISQQG